MPGPEKQEPGLLEIRVIFSNLFPPGKIFYKPVGVSVLIRKQVLIVFSVLETKVNRFRFIIVASQQAGLCT